MHMRAVAYLVVLGAGAASCNGSGLNNTNDGGGGDGGSAVIPIDQLGAKVADTICGLVTQCAGSAAPLLLQGVDCATRFGHQFEDGTVASLKKAIDGKTVIYHGDKVQACLDAIKAAGCAQFQNRLPDVCEQAVEGTVPAGGACTLHAECTGSSYCQVDAMCPGKCAARQAAGTACSADDACQDGLVCRQAGGKTTCLAPATQGQPCEGGNAPPCTFGLLCIGQNGMKNQPGTCRSFAEVFAADQGATCDLQAGAWCKPGLFCVVQSVTGGKPTATCGGAATSGGPCKISLPDQCPAGEYCDADFMKGTIDGTCTKDPAAGEPCAATPFGQVCEPYSRCDGSKTCQVVARIDGACSGSDFCYSGKCSSGKCVDGDACPP